MLPMIKNRILTTVNKGRNVNKEVEKYFSDCYWALWELEYGRELSSASRLLHAFLFAEKASAGAGS